MPEPTTFEQFANREQVLALIERAFAEDLGLHRRDVTGEAMIEADDTGETVFTARDDGVLCGLAILPDITTALDPALGIEPLAADGAGVSSGTPIARMAGPMRSILAVERTALNFLTHLSGIATLTAAFVARVEGTKARICDTRKTIPGLRGLARYAVTCGGGLPHRIGLYDAVLIKDNHIAHLDLDALKHKLSTIVPQIRRDETQLSFIEIEVDTLEQLDIVFSLPEEAWPDIVLLDNMSPAQLGQAVDRRESTAPQVQLEASGGVTLETVRGIAETGVDRIAVGALTHSAPALDIGLDARRESAP